MNIYETNIHLKQQIKARIELRYLIRNTKVGFILEDLLISLIILWAAWKWGDWRHWKQYYPTILFLALGNFIYLFFSFDKPLWRFTTFISSKLAETLMTFLIFPCVILLFLPYFPKQGIVKKTLYVCFWTLLFLFIEWWAIKIHHFAHYNGWSLLYSAIFNLGMFTLIQIHYKKPPWAWLISLITAVIIIIVFKLPLLSK